MTLELVRENEGERATERAISGVGALVIAALMREFEDYRKFLLHKMTDDDMDRNEATEATKQKMLDDILTGRLRIRRE